MFLIEFIAQHFHFTVQEHVKKVWVHKELTEMYFNTEEGNLNNLDKN